MFRCGHVTGQMLNILKHKTCHFIPISLKMISNVKLSIFATTQDWLNIFKNSFIQIEEMDNIYHFYKVELVLIWVLQRSSKKELESKIDYITRAKTGWGLSYELTFPFTLCMVTYTIQQYRTFYGLEHAQLSRLQEVCSCWNRWSSKSWHISYIKGMLYVHKDQSVSDDKAIQTESLTWHIL